MRVPLSSAGPQDRGSVPNVGLEPLVPQRDLHHACDIPPGLSHHIRGMGPDQTMLLLLLSSYVHTKVQTTYRVTL